jgi:hypothetical protein
VEFHSSNVTEEGGRSRWIEAGRPPVPAVVVGGAVRTLFHVSQLAAALGLPQPAAQRASAAAWDLAAILEAWLALLDGLPWELATAPTPSRGRSLRNLTVNTFHPVSLLPEACSSARFDWNPELDEKREAQIGSAATLLAYATEIARLWSVYLLEHGERLAADRVVESARGPLPLADLLAAQRWHAAYHYRQAAAFLRLHAPLDATPLALEAFEGLDLPPEVF